MKSTALKRLAIIGKLSLIPDQKLDEVRSFIEAILEESEISPKSNRSLNGIWRAKGFEEIDDLKAELVEVRKELRDSIQISHNRERSY